MKKFLLLLFIISCTEINAQWQLSNGPYGGMMSGMAENNSGLFASSMNAGVFFSVDRGASWVPRNNGLGDLTVYDMISIGQDIYVGTYAGVYVTHDNGLSWSCLTNSISQLVYSSIIWDGTYLITHTNSHVYSSTDFGASWQQMSIDTVPMQIKTIASINGNLFVGTNIGLYVSNNNGSTWSLIAPGLTWITGIVGLGSRMIIETNSGINYSSDAGVSWSPVSPGLSCPWGNKYYIDGGKIYACSMDNLFMSNDTGQTFTPLLYGNVSTSDVFISNGELYLMTMGGILKSVDGGSSFSSSNFGINAVQANAIYADDNIALLGTYNGIYRSTDNGDSWTLSTAQIQARSLAYHNSKIYAGDFHEAVFVSNDNGLTWIPKNAGIIPDQILSFAFINNEIYANTGNGKIIKSTDEGNSWIDVNQGVISYPRFIVAVDSTLFAGSFNSIYLSNDHGNTWNISSNGIPNVVMNCATVIGNTIFVNAGNEIYKSSDKGMSWTEIIIPQVFSHYYNLHTDGNNLITSTYYNGLMMSPDNGLSWVLYNTGLPDSTVMRIFASNSTRIFANGYYPIAGVWKYDRAITSVANYSSFDSELNVYPNPFLSEAKITYSISKNSNVSIQIYNATGSLVETIFENVPLTTGIHQTTWKNSVPGIYFVRIESSDGVSMQKIISQ